MANYILVDEDDEVTVKPTTVEVQGQDIVVDEDRQQFIGVLGMRGEGKSYIVDTDAERAFLMGYLIMDLHGADNMENAYYVFPSDDPEQRNPIQICLRSGVPDGPGLLEGNIHHQQTVRTRLPDPT